MVDLLAREFGVPLEREFEAWVVHGIESYFAAVGCHVDVFAVSPKDEETWPADQVVRMPGKIVGLQLKRPHLVRTTTPNDFSRLSWNLAQPPRQLARVLSQPEIHYVLPTFINRRLKANALHHCLFWRPTNNMDTQVWYRNDNARTTFKKKCGAPRWGLFLESVLRCHVGLKVKEGFSLSRYINGLRFSKTEQAHDDSEDPSDRIILAVVPTHRAI